MLDHVHTSDSDGKKGNKGVENPQFIVFIQITWEMYGFS